MREMGFNELSLTTCPDQNFAERMQRACARLSAIAYRSLVSSTKLKIGSPLPSSFSM